jgi:thiamine pyrophosphokinase
LPNKRVLLFANGQSPEVSWLKSFVTKEDILIAVDGGLTYLQSLGIPPHLVIGDLDSVTTAQMEWAKAKGSQIEIYPVAKDENDLELALLAAKKLRGRELVIIAGLGGRLDQTLANLSLLRMEEFRDCTIRFEDGREEVFLIRREAKLSGQPGDIVSLLPLWGEATGIVTENLAYPLRQETLYPEHTRGISNVMNGPVARVSLANGELLCIHTHPLNSVKEEKL